MSEYSLSTRESAVIRTAEDKSGEYAREEADEMGESVDDERVVLSSLLEKDGSESSM
jgi:hypothetical protein